MSNQAITNLHKNDIGFKANDNNLGLMQGFKDIQSKIRDLGNRLPDFMGKVDVSGHFKLKALKQKALQKLSKKRKRFRLALESLGWGTLADMLDAAFCGEKLNIWV